MFGRVVAHFEVCWRAFLDVPKIHDTFDLDGRLLQLIGHIHNHALYQRRTADRLLHAQLTAFHAARQIDLAFAGQERNGTHLAEVYTNGIVRIDGLFHRSRMQKVCFMGSLGVEEFGIFFEIEAQALGVLR
jgi:hypothetical protein